MHAKSISPGQAIDFHADNGDCICVEKMTVFYLKFDDIQTLHEIYEDFISTQLLQLLLLDVIKHL